MTQHSCTSLLITSGNGPAECQQAVVGVLNVMQAEARACAVDFDASLVATKHGAKSAVVVLGGAV